jgi:hypothetical protein
MAGGFNRYRTALVTRQAYAGTDFIIARDGPDCRTESGAIYEE